MKNSWQTKKLSEVCEFQNGFAFKSKLFKEDGFPVLRISNIQSDGISYNRLVFFDKKSYKDNFDRYQVLKGDLVIAMSGATTGKLAISDADEIFYLNQRVGKFKPRKDLSKDYLYHFLSTRIEENLKISAGSAQPNLSTEQIKDFKIPLPSISEQKRIVKILDEVFEKTAKAKENAEKNLQNSKELFKSYLQSVFANPGKDWEEKRLEELGKITSSKRIYKKEYVKDGVPFYRIKEIKELAHDKNITLELYISEKRYKEIKDVFGVPLEGDILMTAVGTIGEIYVVKKDEKFYFKDGNILWFKNFNSVNPYFLKFVLMSFVEQINKLSKGSAYSALTIEKIEKHRIFLPKSISEQKSIVKKLNALSTETKKLEAIYRQKLADLEELKKSVLKKAFAGNL